MKKLLLMVIGGMIALNAYPNCAMCHNGGVGMKLDNLKASEIKEDLIKFKTGEMHHDMMNFVKNMSLKEIEEASNKYGKKGK